MYVYILYLKAETHMSSSLYLLPFLFTDNLTPYGRVQERPQKATWLTLTNEQLFISCPTPRQLGSDRKLYVQFSSV